MSEIITAIYEGGLLRPTEPLTLAEGSRVRVTLESADGPGLYPDRTTDDEAGRARRQEARAFVQSLLDAKGTDDLPDGYDFLDALNANRGPGQRPLFPPDPGGAAR